MGNSIRVWGIRVVAFLMPDLPPLRATPRRQAVLRYFRTQATQSLPLHDAYCGVLATLIPPEYRS
ncbi:hypothetical protein J6590_019747 [Homalodisca vitripennis]|nr:hypothetical protein J6590_019747 [Homalodisca vitripennis]